VEIFLDEVAQAVEALEQALDASSTEIQRLERRVIEGPRGEEVVQAVNIISSAQRTADGVVAEADSYSTRVMTNARELYDDATRRVAQLEAEAEENLRRLTVSAQIEQHELDRQTAYLRTLRDVSRTQMERFLASMLEHIAGEYGRAHPIAAQAVPMQMMAEQTTDEPGIQDSPAELSAEAPSVHAAGNGNGVEVDSLVTPTNGAQRHNGPSQRRADSSKSSIDKLSVR
jgi:cell division septum initiation protein DivIVA